MKSIVIMRQDGGITIVNPAPEMFDPTSRTRALVPELGGKSDDEILAWIADKNGATADNSHLVDISDLPQDRTFRDAWKSSNSVVDVDRNAARAIIRQKRNQALTVLDGKAAAEARKPNGNITAINTKAQRLRDIPEDPAFMSDDLTVLKTLLQECNV